MRLNYIVQHSALNPPLVSGSLPLVINHGWLTAAISHELQDVLFHELQNGPCRKTFELEYLEIFIKL